MSYKILSLDGGANRSLLQCMALQALYPGMRGRSILQRFNLVVANSGGSLVLARLLKDETLEEILETFDHPDSPASLFVKLPLRSRLKSLGLGPKFSTLKKRERIAAALEAIADIPMRDLSGLFSGARPPPKIVVVGFDYDQLRAAFFRSFNTRAGARVLNATLTDAVNASSTAPVAYFDEPARVGERRYWDGAIAGYNNPVMAALAEAFVDGAAASSIVVLSLGTATTIRVPLDHPVRNGPKEFFASSGRACLLADVAKLAGSILDEPVGAAVYSAYVVLGNSVLPGPEHPSPTLVRLNPSIQPVFSPQRKEWVAPEGLTRYELKALMNLPGALMTDGQVDMAKNLGRQWLDGRIPNEPIRRDDNLGCFIGDETFSAGRERWLAFDAA